MVKETLEYLRLGPGKVVIDATVGTGGHSRNIIERIMPGGRLIAIDRDEESLSVAKARLADFSNECEFIYGNFSEIDSTLKTLGIPGADAILFDLGISSYQLKNPQRGFSFQNEGPLDMRMDRNSYISAYDLINNLNEEELSTMLKVFGQERWHNRIAHHLVKERERHPISSTLELSNIVVESIPHKYRFRSFNIHPATRTFQAVRIAVNRELEAVETALSKAVRCLNKGGVICAISFHSLEDRAVKWTFRKEALDGLIRIITSKPLTPSLSEVRENPSSRSSKLRVAERI